MKRPYPNTQAPSPKSQAEDGSNYDRPAELEMAIIDKDGFTSKLLIFDGKVNGQIQRVLVDGGASGDFISAKVVEKLELPVKAIKGVELVFANGQKEVCNKI